MARYTHRWLVTTNWSSTHKYKFYLNLWIAHCMCIWRQSIRVAPGCGISYGHPSYSLINPALSLYIDSSIWRISGFFFRLLTVGSRWNRSLRIDNPALTGNCCSRTFIHLCIFEPDLFIFSVKNVGMNEVKKHMIGNENEKALLSDVSSSSSEFKSRPTFVFCSRLPWYSTNKSVFIESDMMMTRVQLNVKWL